MSTVTCQACGQPKSPGFGLGSSALLFGSAGSVLYLETHLLIPYLARTTGVEPVVFWFLVAGLGMFVPLLLVAAVLLKREGVELTRCALARRLRLGALSREDLRWCLGGTLAIGLLSFLSMQAVDTVAGGFDRSPPFLAFEPLSGARLWILGLWLPYWVLNILGEELVWRGVILPRQEASFGRWAWLAHGLGWCLFHVCFGWQLLVTLLPILFILPYIVQKRANTWIGVFLHAVLNGPSFIAIALGWI